MSSGIEDPGPMLQAAVDKLKDVSKEIAFTGFRNLLFTIQDGVTKLSRVDTGHYKSNWFVSINQAPGGTIATPRRAPLGRLAKGQKRAKRAPSITGSGGVIGELDPKADINTAYIHNNVAYAAFLEAKYRPLARAVEQRTGTLR